jgi:hypothetical protein
MEKHETENVSAKIAATTTGAATIVGVVVRQMSELTQEKKQADYSASLDLRRLTKVLKSEK